MKIKQWIVALIVVALSVGSILFLSRTSQEKKRKPTLPQFVLFTFDDGGSAKFWSEALGFAKEQNIQLTFFVNAANYYPLSAYGNPEAGAKEKEDIVLRLRYLNQALEEGHEIASHGPHHVRGAYRNREEWNEDFDLMDRVARERIFPNKKPPYFVGYRAPHHSWNEAMFDVMVNRSFLYDASQVYRPRCRSLWPGEVRPGLVEFPIRALIDRKGKRKATSDWTLFERDGRPSKSSTERKKAAYDLYLDAFELLYRSSRAPLVILTHFSSAVLSGGDYFAAVKDFAKGVCKRENVRCTTLASAAQWVRENAELYRALPKGSTAFCTHPPKGVARQRGN